MVYQHDGALPRFTTRVREFLNQQYGNQWIGRYGHVAWPARSPDLTPLDFYLWGAVKQQVYEKDDITSKEILLEKVQHAIADVKEKLREMNLKNEIEKRLYYCIQAEGRHFEQLLK